MRAWLAATMLLAGCSAVADLQEPVEPIGAFSLGHTVVVAEGAQKVPPSREASAEEWQSVLEAALQERFGRFSGDQLYHLAVKVDAYALAVPGVPVVLSPKSILRIQVSVWDDAAGGKINPEPRVFTVFERLSGETVLGSGLTRTREQQMAQLAANSARLIEGWMRENPGWFAPRYALPTELPAPLEGPGAQGPSAAPPLATDRPGVSPDIGDVITPAQ
ncbi:hypothetical protein [Oceanicola sp. 502str15]|uniref:hypothetical protein n=1 Tax=Oceanicola sp. 502str15 TaxID=2696061 RepID=UPI002094EB7F|nr:hypothetical protein [Oceanicola sp. 502str15]MCO6385012.1 hypothetical protein [Oceanicola sp. 502str15]